MRAKEFLKELKLPKNTWELIMSNSSKHGVGDNLVDLVQTAYSK